MSLAYFLTAWRTRRDMRALQRSGRDTARAEIHGACTWDEPEPDTEPVARIDTLAVWLRADEPSIDAALDDIAMATAVITEAEDITAFAAIARTTENETFHELANTYRQQTATDGRLRRIVARHARAQQRGDS